MATLILRLCAVLIGLRGVVNLFKSLGAGNAMVAFGYTLPPDSLLAPLIGVAMIALAIGLWTRRRWALPLAVGYAVFASLNIILFPLVSGLHPPVTGGRYVAFAFGGLIIVWGAVALLRRELAPAGG
jgi:hypothetical protein